MCKFFQDLCISLVALDAFVGLNGSKLGIKINMKLHT